MVIADPPSWKEALYNKGPKYDKILEMIAELNTPTATPANHASEHENGGGDEINVGGLSGLLADPQTPAAHSPAAHKASHQNGGGDEISVAGLSGELADDQPPKAHESEHESGGGDAMAHDSIAGSGSNAHSVIDTHLGASNPHSGSASTTYDIAGTYRIWISPYPDRATNLIGAGTYGGGSYRYVYGSGGIGIAEIEMGQYIPYQIASRTIVVTSIIAYFWHTSGTPVLTLYREHIPDTDVNRAQITVATDNTLTTVAASLKILSIAPSHTMLTDYSYQIYITDMPNSTSCRWQGMYLEFSIS